MGSPVARLIEWARDAHAMEKQAETMLAATAKRLENYPNLKARLDQHLEETRRQAKILAEEIERLGGATSMMKDFTARAVAAAQGLSGMFVGDEVIKAMLASYTFEQMEIASYRILIAAADHCGERQFSSICEEILREEEAMAGWLADHIPQITTRYLHLEQTPGATAKH